MITRRTLRTRSVWFALLFIGLVADVSAQWQSQPGAPDVDYYAIERLDGQTIHGAGSFSLLRSTNNGASWDTTYVTVFGVQFPCALYDVHFFNAQEGVASGFMSLGSQFVILRTTDAGQNWSVAYLSETGGLLRWIQDIEFGSATEGFAVGSDNRLLKTTNGGQNWTQQSPPSGSHLYDFQYGAGNVRHIAGQGRILRSIDGGLNWTTQSFPQYDLRALHFPSAQRGYAGGESGAFLRTDDGGLSWDPIEVPFTTGIKDLHFISDDEGYAVAGTRIWHTTTGGDYWEWFECGEEMRAVSFSGGDGFAVGFEGAMFRSTSGTGGYHPVALFAVSPAVHCEDSLVVLTNLSDPLLSNTWLYNGVPFANTPDASLVIDSPQQTDTISLVVNNGSIPDTLTLNITIAASLNIDVTASLVQDTLCNGSSTQVQVPASISGVTYRLRRGLTDIGNPQTGNNGTLTFSTGTINGQDTLNILATRAVAGCGTGRDSTYLVIHGATPATGLTITVVDPVICIGENADILLSGAQNGVVYQLKKGTQNIGPPQTGMGGQLTFNSGALEFNTTFSVFATHPFGCTATLSSTATVMVDRPEPYFSLSSLNPEAGANISVLNTSGPATGYAWDFGPNATPTSSAEMDPGNVVFTTPGNVEVSLTITSAAGCTNTTVITIHVIDPVEPGTCDGVQGYHIGGSGGNLAGMRYDQNGDVYIVANNANSEDLRFYGGHGDTLVEILDNDFNALGESYQVVKVAATGVPQWLVRVRHGSTWAQSGDVAVDGDGNIYMVFFHGDHHDSVSVYNSDNRVAVTFQPPWESSSYQSAILVSWDAQGNYRWHNTWLEPYWLEHLRLVLDDVGDVYAMGDLELVKFDGATGAQAWIVPHDEHDPYNEYVDMCRTPDGTLHVVRTFDLTVDRYAPDGSFLGQADLAENVDVPGFGASQIVARGIAADVDGSLYITGHFRGRCVIGNDTLEDLLQIQGQENDLFLVKLDADGEVAWTRQIALFGLDGYYDHGGITVGNGHVLTLGQYGLLSISMEGCPPMVTDDNSHVIIHVDTSGGTPRLASFPGEDAGTNGYFGGLSYWDNAIVHDPSTGRLAANANYANAFEFGGQTIQPHVQPYVGNVFVGMGEIACFVPSLPSPTATPLSWFTADLPACTGQSVQFTDASLNEPTAWSWTFEGGTPSTSDLAAPLVTFATPGDHAVTLTASNSNGTGTSFTLDIAVDICTGWSMADLERMTVRPSVSSDRITISASAFAGEPFRITDMEGRTVATGTLSDRTEVDVHTLAPGSYAVGSRSMAPVRFVVVR